MRTEIERKFLVGDDRWRRFADDGVGIRQGYFETADDTSIRIRIAGGDAWLTIKGRAQGITRPEFEYAIPVNEAESMFELFCRSARIEKTRYRLTHAGRHWEIDVFDGDNRGLVLAEIELRDEHDVFEVPEWVGREVSEDPRFLNARLARDPVARWPKKE
jgi:adenylate cyclase